MKLNKYLILIVVFSIISINNVSAKYAIKFGIHVNKISINKSTPIFESEFYWWMKFDLNNSKIDTANPLSNIEFVNGENIENRIMEKKVIGNEYYVVGKMKGIFTYKSDYRNYPFDRQNLEIIIENTTDEKDECKIIADSLAFFNNGKINYNKIIHDKIFLEGISLNKIEILENEGIYNTNFGDPTVHNKSIYSRLVYKFEVKRHYFSYFLKLIIPLFIPKCPLGIIPI